MAALASTETLRVFVRITRRWQLQVGDAANASLKAPLTNLTKTANGPERLIGVWASQAIGAL